MTSYDKAIKLDPTNTEYQNNKEIVLKKISEMDNAPKSSSQQTRGIEVNAIRSEGSTTLYTKGVELFNDERYDEALVYFDKALVLDPKDFDTLKAKGDSLYILGRFE